MTAPTLCETAALGDAARVRRRARTEPSALALRSPDGWPALHLAAHFGHGDAVDALVEADDVPIVNTLLAHGAAADARADDGKTALTIAEERGHAHVARRLRGELP